MLKQSPKQLERRDTFKKIGKVISQLEYDWRERREDFEYQFKPTPTQDPLLTSKMYGPAMKVVQWDKTVRRD